jgi:hypothetical protein
MSLEDNIDAAAKAKPKRSFGKLEPLFIGFMRMITLNIKLFCKPTQLGWRKT